MPEVLVPQLTPLSELQYIVPSEPQLTNLEFPNATSSRLAVCRVIQFAPLSVEFINLVPRATKVLLPFATPDRISVWLQVPAFHELPLSLEKRMVPL